MSLRLSAMPVTTMPSSLPVMSGMAALVSAARAAGHARPGTGHRWPL
jgi:hypothetical protein